MSETSKKGKKVQGLKYAEDIIKEIREREKAEQTEETINGEEFEAWLRRNDGDRKIRT